MVALTSADVAMASRMASHTPAAFLGLDAEIGTLSQGGGQTWCGWMRRCNPCNAGSAEPR
jgi:N-acetylglucosamine-6-phosphate deacetylase